MIPVSITQGSGSEVSGEKKTLLANLNAIRTKSRDIRENLQEGTLISIEDLTSQLAENIIPVAETLGMSQMQVLILASAIERSSRYRFDLSDLAEEMGMSFIRLLSFNDDLEDLKKKGYIKVDKDRRVNIPKAVINALAKNRPYEKPATTGLSTVSMMRRFHDIFEDIDDDIIEDSQALEELDNLVKGNPDTAFARTCSRIDVAKYDEEERQLFYALADMYYAEHDDMINWDQVENAFYDDIVPDILRDRTCSGRLKLMNDNIVEFTSDDGVKTKDYIHITDDVKARLFEDAGGLRKRHEPIAGVIEHGSIAPKELYYEKHEAEQIATLERMLTDEGYDAVCKALKAKNMRTGLTVLLHGAPGTGKTACVYELARRTGRDIILADVSKIKNCFVGETEKNIKNLFDSYRRSIKEDSRPKILLFNEADAIFGVRKEGSTDAVDKMEGSLQNIILQEMEDLEGILIATTNLTGSFDKAFMRRFLYKIEFSRPSAECKSKIWKSMIPELTDEQARELSRDYDSFTGGNIENICRKKTIQSIVSGHEPDFNELTGFCDDESLTKTRPGRRIGY